LASSFFSGSGGASLKDYESITGSDTVDQHTVLKGFLQRKERLTSGVEGTPGPVCSQGEVESKFLRVKKRGETVQIQAQNHAEMGEKTRVEEFKSSQDEPKGLRELQGLVDDSLLLLRVSDLSVALRVSERDRR
jgi:hypothetical protein